MVAIFEATSVLKQRRNKCREENVIGGRNPVGLVKDGFERKLISRDRDVPKEGMTGDNEFADSARVRLDSFVSKPHGEVFWGKSSGPRRIRAAWIGIESATGARRGLSKVKVNFFGSSARARGCSSWYMYAG